MSRAVIEAAWRPLTTALARRDGVGALAAVDAARQVGLLQACGPAVLLALAAQAWGAGEVAGQLSQALTVRAWPGDAELAELLTGARTGADTGRDRISVDLDDLADLCQDQGGGWIDLRSGTCWPQELLDLGDVEDVPDPEADSADWLWVGPADSREGWTDMAAFCDELADTPAASDLRAAINGRGAFSRFQKALDRHDSHRAAWRVHSSESRTGRARRWLADVGYDATP
jgi:hypothetical protein